MGRRFPAAAEDDQPTLRIGPDLAEIDARTEKLAGIERVFRATAGIAAGIMPRAGIDDQACRSLIVMFRSQDGGAEAASGMSSAI